MNCLRLKTARISRGVTSKAMANAIGRCEAAWNQRERGEKIPDVKEVAIITTVLGLTVQEFFDIFFDNDLLFRNNDECSYSNYDNFIMRG